MGQTGNTSSENGETIELTMLEAPTGPLFDQVYDLVESTFRDPRIIMSREKMRKSLKETEPENLSHHCLMAFLEDEFAGVSLYYYLSDINIGYGSEMVVQQHLHGKGVGRALFEGRLDDLNRRAHTAGNPEVRGLIIDVSNPDDMTSEQIETDREHGMDPYERRELWEHMGYRLLMHDHFIPHTETERVEYLDLAFLPLNLPGEYKDRIPAKWLETFYRTMWTDWLGAEQAEKLLGSMDLPRPYIPLGSLTVG